MPKKEPLYPHISKSGKPKVEVSEEDKAKLRNLVYKIDAQRLDEEKAAREYHDLVILIDALPSVTGLNLVALSNSIREIASDEEEHRGRLEFWRDKLSPYWA